jgi:hypothetical protein
METDGQSVKLITVTLDTSVLGHNDVKELKQTIAGLPIQLAHTSVTAREIENTDFVAPGPSILETGVYGESRWGQAVWGGVDESTLLESILYTISPGYPRQGKREGEKFSKGDQHHLRDAMILVAHTRSHRDIFVTKEKKAFIGKRDDLRRKQLEVLCNTKIMNLDEFFEYCRELRENN